MTSSFAIPFGPAFIPGAAVQLGPSLFDDFTQSSYSATLDAAAWADKSFVTLTGTATSANAGTVLTDTAATFISDGVRIGDTVDNVTDGSAGTVVTVDSETQITHTALAGGTQDDWDVGETWTIVVVGGGLTLAAVDGGVLTVSSGSVAGNDGVAELNGVSFAFNVNRDLYFETRLRIDAATGGQTFIDNNSGNATALFVGVTPRNFSGREGAPTAECIGFATQGDDQLDFLVHGEGAGGGLTIQDTLYDFEYATYAVLAFYWNGTSRKLHAYVDSRRVKTYEPRLHNFPDFDTEFTVHIAVERTAGTGGTVDVDYVYCATNREMSGLWDGSP